MIYNIQIKVKKKREGYLRPQLSCTLVMFASGNLRPAWNLNLLDLA